MKALKTLIGTVLLAGTAFVFPEIASAQQHVQFDGAERRAGSGYNNTHYDRRVSQPRSILKGSRANRAVHAEQRFNQRLGAQTRGTMRHRGDVARQARASANNRTVLNATGRKVQFDTSPRRAGSGYNNTRYDRRVSQPKSILKGSRANRAVHAERRFNQRLGSKTRSTMRQRGDIARHARKSRAVKSTLKGAGRSARVARKARMGRNIAKAAGGGLVVAGGYYAVESTLGVDIPDAFEAAEWTYGTLKNPKNAGKRFEKLGRDSYKELDKGWRTLQNPNRMARNLENAGKKTAKGAKKAACSIGKLFSKKAC